MPKYPYISDKKMYAAVMCACKYIRETGYFNKAVRNAAEWYHVDEEKLAEEIRKRQSAGKKAKNEGKTFKMKEFIVSCYCFTEAYGDNDLIWKKKVKGKSKETVERRFNEWAWNETKRNDTGSAFSPSFFVSVEEVEKGETK